MKCVYCRGERVVKNGKDQISTQVIQRYLCRDCGQRFNERSATPMARLRTPAAVISMAMKVRSEEFGIRATVRVSGKSDGSIINWEKRLSAQLSNWSPNAPERGEVMLEGDEVYTRVGKNLPPVSDAVFGLNSEGWTVHFIERNSRYWVDAQAGLKDVSLFEKGVKAAWDWASPSEWIRWVTNGERRYSNELWTAASVYLPDKQRTQSYGYRKVWRDGLEVAIKVKGSQGKPHVAWIKPEHPFTAISSTSDVHANHNEAQNSSLRRRANAYHRRQNHYAKVVEGLQGF